MPRRNTDDGGRFEVDADLRAASDARVKSDATTEPTALGERRPPFSAVVLAAGQSTRMGREKALLEVDGQPMWQRQRDLLARAGASEIFLSVRPEQPWAGRASGFAALVHDATPSCGPISGITAAIERASRPHVAVLAIDLPRMRVEWFEKLLGDCAAGVGAVGRRGGFFEPLAAIYPREMMTLAWEALAGGRYSLQALLTRAVEEGLLRVREIAAGDAAWFENWNEEVFAPQKPQA